MPDLLKTLYGLVGAPHPIASLIIAIILGGMFFGLGWILIGHQYSLDHPIKKQEPIKPQQALGNLKHRAITLSEEIIADLHSHGWYEEPSTSTAEVENVLLRTISNRFRMLFLERTLVLIDEFARLHLRDIRLDNFSIEIARDQQRQGGASSKTTIHPLTIIGVAENLKILAQKINN